MNPVLRAYPYLSIYRPERSLRKSWAILHGHRDVGRLLKNRMEEPSIRPSMNKKAQLMRHRVNHVIDSDPDSQPRHLLRISWIVCPLPRIADIGIERNHHHQPLLIVVDAHTVRHRSP